MEKELFIRCLDAIQMDVEDERTKAKKLAEVFPNAFSANFIPDKNHLQNALLEVLEVAMNDTVPDEHGNTWIAYFCWELDFGRENYRLTVAKNGQNIPMSNASELWEFLNAEKKKS
jgi:hypothetical protein